MTEHVSSDLLAHNSVEARISDPDSLVAHLEHVRRVVWELDPNDTAPLWQPQEELVHRAQVESVTSTVISNMVSKWYILRPAILPQTRRPDLNKAVTELAARSQGNFSHLTLSRLAISETLAEKVGKKHPDVIEDSLEHYEMGVAVYRGRRTPICSSLGLIGYARPDRGAGGRVTTRYNVQIVPSTGAAELHAKAANAAATARNVENIALRRPASGGLPGTRRH